MTIKKMRAMMKEKVVPEEIVPPNVINRLIDEEAEPPKLDAFAFLMRLRALGIGSSDFVDLLEGCDAPENVVKRIKSNPAMNLQGLILTLDNSELTSDDYTRMLLTARQVWERTLTLRLERSEKLSHELEQELEPLEPEEVGDEPQETEAAETDEFPEEAEQDDTEPADDGEEYGEEEFDADYDEDLLEMSFTAVLNKINAEILDGTFAPGAADKEPETEEIEKAEETEEAEKAEETPKEAVEEQLGEESDFTAAFDKIKKEKAEISPEAEAKDDNEEKSPEITEDSAPLRTISADYLRKSIGVPPEDEDDNDEAAGDEGEKEYEDKEEDEKEEYDDEEYDGEESGETSRRGYHKNAIIGGAAGAAVLVAAGAIIGHALGSKGADRLSFAKEASDIFDKVYYAYDKSVAGGDLVCETSPDLNAVFGDLLIGGSDPASIGLFTQGDVSYSVTETEISSILVENGKAVTPEKIIPPEKARFVAAFDENGKLYAVFSGKQSGFIKLSGGKAEFTVLQDGILTDYDFSDGEIRLGTVYTPVFGHTFSIDDKSEYLPKTGVGEPAPIPVKNVIISDTNGYSYGVSAGYSLKDGKTTEVCAVMGDPVAASADGRFVLKGDSGLIVKSDGKKLRAETTGKAAFAALGRGACAVIERSDSGENVINLFNEKLKPVAELTGAPDKISGLWFVGSVLTVTGDENIVIRVDCSEPDAPKPLSLRAVRGVVSGNSAIALETDDTKLTLTRYELENGAAKKIAEFTKTLPENGVGTVKLGESAAMVFDGGNSGAAYSYFDGVSVVSEYVVFAEGSQPKVVSVFDDKTGFTAAYKNNGSVNAVCGEGVKVVK